MVRAKETAEEQLLRMIEGPTGGQAPGPLRRLSPEQWLEQLRGGLERLRRWALPTRDRLEGSDEVLWRLHLGERVLWILLAALGCYLLAELVWIRRQPPTMTLQISPSDADALSGRAGAAAEDRLKPLAEYQKTLLARNPFGLSASALAPDQAQASRLSELAGALAVVGVNRGRVPEALIEDTSAKRTYVVKVGDEVNGLVVKSIDERGVVVSYEGEETLIP